MSTTTVSDLKCEYFVNPIGIDIAKPRLSWKLQDSRRGAKQTAYEIEVTSSDKWSSGKINSDQSIQVVYGGPALKSRTRYQWRVRIWDQDGKESAWSEPAFFETGFFDQSEWKGQWIGSPELGGPYSSPPVPYVRKAFDVSKPIARARLYVTALGIYEIEVNGKKVSHDNFLPGRTEYQFRVNYQVYELESFLANGQNVIGAILGDGWYCGHIHSDPRMYYGDRPRIMAQVMIDYTDGSSETILTDSSWKTGTGPIRSSDILMGEDYDARREIEGWSTPTFDDSKWFGVATFADPGLKISFKRAPNVRTTQEIKPIAPPTISANKRRWLYDLGQNMVGHVKLKLKDQKPGQTIDLRHVEMLDKDGKPYVTALRTARATDHYTTKGGDETYEPRFTFHGFRYVEVRDVKGSPDDNTITGVVVHSDTKKTGTFECSDPMINQLQSNITWSQRGNFLEVPTDCPQRDERLGWTGDAQVFIRTAAFNMDVAGFFTQWLQMMSDSQPEDGRISSVIPLCPSIYGEGGPAWADAAVICPWTLYLCYGDTRILEDCYPMMSKFIQFMVNTCPGYIRADEKQKWRGYGDWLSQNADTPNDLIGTAFFAYSAKLMSDIAKILGKSEDSKKYETLSNEVKKAWQNRYVTPDGNIVAQTQTAYLLALHFNLIDEKFRPTVVDSLVRNIKKRGMHLSTGFVGTPYLNDVLTDNGHIDVAYALLNQKTFPSWLFPITHGATTMWERWDGWTPEKGFNDAGMNSYNHYAYGAVGDWMYRVVAGIDVDPSAPGYKKIIIAPRPGGGLTYAKATLESEYGTIKSGWKIDGDKLTLNVTIPPNTSATIRIPTTDASSITEGGKPFGDGKTSFTVGAGEYVFGCKLG